MNGAKMHWTWDSCLILRIFKRLRDIQLIIMAAFQISKVIDNLNATKMTLDMGLLSNFTHFSKVVISS